MYRKHMTEEQWRKKKQEQRRYLHGGIRMEHMYPEVEKIEILHTREHRSFSGVSRQEGIWTMTPQSEFSFVLECLNRECSSIGFDLGKVICFAIRDRKNEISGEMECEGQEAPDHPEQSCEGSLKYSIKITYKR